MINGIIYLQVTGSRSCGREIIAIVADDTNIFWYLLCMNQGVGGGLHRPCFAPFPFPTPFHFFLNSFSFS